MADIAQNSGGEVVSAHTIATRQSIPEPYLETIAGILRRARLLRSVRGAAGGFVLARRAGDITVGEILRVLEGSLSSGACDGDGAGCGMSGCETCAALGVTSRIDAKVSEVVDNMTLADLVSD
jgi:Rrf2 family protein